eukprot:gene11754-24650_t
MAGKPTSLEEVSDEFRAAVRLSANEAGKSVKQFLHGVFGPRAIVEGNAKLLSFAAFETGVKSLRKKFNKSDVEDIFEECDMDGNKRISVDALVEFCQKNVSKARLLSLKLRNAICTHFNGESGFRGAFSTMAGTSKYLEIENFRDFADEYLDRPMSENEALSVYSLFDTDGDGKVSLDDFLNFMITQKSDATKCLEPKNIEAIIDIKISLHRSQEAELLRQGYIQLIPDLSQTNIRTLDAAAIFGTFGRGQSLWIWKRKQGTCCGRLKSILDIQLQKCSSSSALVMSGYTCLPETIAGQYIWIRRATSDEDDLDAIIDLYVTIGKISNAADHIWSGPGIGWIRVDGNFNKSFLGGTDAFLWFKPSRARSADMLNASPIRNVVLMSESRQKTNLMTAIKAALRHYVPLHEMKRISNYKHTDIANTATTISDRAGKTSDSNDINQDNFDENDIRDDRDRDREDRRHFDFAFVYHMYDRRGTGRLGKSSWHKMLCDVGVAIDKADITKTFVYFDISHNDSISREEYAVGLTLTAHEIDLVAEDIRNKLMNSIVGQGKLKRNRILGEIFQILNSNNDKMLSVAEILNMSCKLDIYLSEEEGRKIAKLMDLDNNDRVEERDFVAFMKKAPDATICKAHRVKEAAAMCRRWLVRGSKLGV